MANTIAKKLEENWKSLPNATSGNGQNFIYLLKNLLKNLTAELNSKFEEISKINNSVTDTPETIDEQLKNCKVKEVRVGTVISLILTWDSSDIKNYESAEIYIKEHAGDISTVIDWSTVDISKTIRTTKVNTYTVDGINAGYVYQITFVGKNNLGSVSEKDNAPVLTYAVSALNNVPDPPLEFDVYFSREGVLWKWKQPVGLDYSYSELRVDQNVGNKIGLLEVTQDTKSTVLPPTREGTAYLYNKGYGSKYSTPLDKEWSKPVPTAPQTFKAEKTFRGILFTYSKIPEDCIGIIISINGEKHYTQDDTWTYYCTTGNFVVKACYYDIFGEGTWTEESTVAVYTEIDPDWLKDESITLAKVDTTIKDAVKDAQDSVGKINTINGSIAQLEKTDASITSTVVENKKAQDTQNATFISQIKQNADSITSVVTSVGETNKKVDSNYSAILQNQKDIALRVKSDDIINQINISKEGVRIDGNKVHITGDTVFDKGVIVSSYIGDKQVVGTKIADGAIETDKLAANAVTAGKIATNAVTTDKIDAGAVTTDKIKAGAVTADTIGAGAITSDKLTAGAVTADKLAANEIKLAGALKVVGGNVTLDENGLTCKTLSKGSVIFNSSGMIFKDSLNNTFAALGRFCAGVANDGDTVKFASAWDVVPTVFLFPNQLQTSAVGYTNVNIWQHIEPLNITKEGFKVCCQSVLKAGSGGSFAVNAKFANWDLDKYNSGQTFSYTLNVPTTATKAQLNLVGKANGATFVERWDEDYLKYPYDAVLYVKFEVDGKMYSNFTEIGKGVGGPASVNYQKQINLKHNSKITISAMFKAFYRGHETNDTDGEGDKDVNGYCTLQSYSVDTASDSVIAHGTAGFIAIDPNSCPYTVTKG